MKLVSEAISTVWRAKLSVPVQESPSALTCSHSALIFFHAALPDRAADKVTSTALSASETSFSLAARFSFIASLPAIAPCDMPRCCCIDWIRRCAGLIEAIPTSSEREALMFESRAEYRLATSTAIATIIKTPSRPNFCV